VMRINPDPPTLMIASASGTPRSLDGTWTRCNTPADNGTPTDTLDIFFWAGTSLTGRTDAYASTTGVCTGAVTPGTPATVVVTSAGTAVAGGWANNSVVTSAPAAAGGGSLPNPPTVTKVVSPGVGLKTILFIDDTAAQWHMYGDYSSVPGTVCEFAAGAYPACLWAHPRGGYLKQ
jgi:hypothetical protein